VGAVFYKGAAALRDAGAWRGLGRAGGARPDRVGRRGACSFFFAAHRHPSTAQRCADLHTTPPTHPPTHQGGVKKEFFQLLVAELLSPDFGMLVYQPESHTYWFNACSLVRARMGADVRVLSGRLWAGRSVCDTPRVLLQCFSSADPCATATLPTPYPT